MITHLSPTSLKIFETNPEDFYLQYKLRLKRLPQTKAMAIGSAFDARVKAWLVERLGGSQLADQKFDLNTLYDAQVELHNRELVRADSERLFNYYMECGAMADLLIIATDLCSSTKFELDIKGLVNFESGEVPIRGKPDMAFRLHDGTVLIQDWKVNGFYSKASPKPGYINIRPDRRPHKNAVLGQHAKMTINIGDRLSEDWEDQVITYGWLMGVPVGEAFLAGIEQLACNGSEYRAATFRVLIGRDAQMYLYRRYKAAWDIIKSDHFFRTLSKEASQKKCAQLDALAAAPEGSNDKWLLENTR